MSSAAPRAAVRVRVAVGKLSLRTGLSIKAPAIRMMSSLHGNANDADMKSWLRDPLRPPQNMVQPANPRPLCPQSSLHRFRRQAPDRRLPFRKNRAQLKRRRR